MGTFEQSINIIYDRWLLLAIVENVQSAHIN